MTLRRYASVTALAGALLALPALGQRSDPGTVTIQASVSGYVDIAAGGPATLSGASGGTITGNLNKGDPLSGLTISFGDVSPVNTSAFVKATVPLRLRSNIGYVLSVSATVTSTTEATALQANDVAFGIEPPVRSDSGVNLAGVDTPVSAVTGDPSLDPDQDPASARWDFKTEKSLAHYLTSRSILSGERIMNVVPRSFVGGLLLNTYFAIKPQFFSPGAFTTSVTFTISTP